MYLFDLPVLLGWRRLKPLQIRMVLRTRDQLLVSHELGFSQIEDRFISVPALNAVLPGLFEFEAFDAGHEIHTIRGMTELDDAAGVDEIFDVKIQRSKAEVTQRCEKTGGVFGGGLDPEIDILREAWLGVEGDREAADDEGLNLPGVEEREQFFEVLRYVHR